LFAPLTDKMGGAIWTLISGVGLVGSIAYTIGGLTPDTTSAATLHSGFNQFLWGMLAIFLFAGIGNASTFKQMPMIFERRQAGGVIGWTAAIAAFGPFLFGVGLNFLGAVHFLLDRGSPGRPCAWPSRGGATPARVHPSPAEHPVVEERRRRVSPVVEERRRRVSKPRGRSSSDGRPLCLPRWLRSAAGASPPVVEERRRRVSPVVEERRRRVSKPRGRSSSDGRPLCLPRWLRSAAGASRPVVEERRRRVSKPPPPV
jgi:hypothetical protein